MAGDRLKSSFELAMERFRTRDAAEGVEHKPLSDAQKEAIAEIRRVYEAKIAELEILHRSKTPAAIDPGERDVLEDGYRRERDRLLAERDARIERARSASVDL